MCQFVIFDIKGCWKLTEITELANKGPMQDCSRIVARVLLLIQIQYICYKIVAGLLNFFHVCYALITRLFWDHCKIVTRLFICTIKMKLLRDCCKIVARLFLTFHICYTRGSQTFQQKDKNPGSKKYDIYWIQTQKICRNIYT